MWRCRDYLAETHWQPDHRIVQSQGFFSCASPSLSERYWLLLWAWRLISTECSHLIFRQSRHHAMSSRLRAEIGWKRRSCRTYWRRIANISVRVISSTDDNFQVRIPQCSMTKQVDFCLIPTKRQSNVSHELATVPRLHQTYNWHNLRALCWLHKALDKFFVTRCNSMKNAIPHFSCCGIAHNHTFLRITNGLLTEHAWSLIRWDAPSNHCWLESSTLNWHSTVPTTVKHSEYSWRTLKYSSSGGRMLNDDVTSQ